MRNENMIEPQNPQCVQAVVSGGAFCSHCNNFWEEKFAVDFEDGICTPCRSVIFIENEDRLDEECLVKYNQKNGTSFSIDEFWSHAGQKLISKESCKGFPRMKEILDYCENLEKEYLAEENFWKNYQPTLFDNFNDAFF